uniref:NADH:ubiquinone reductase (H(+)-translocating) n=1 Tax=Cornu aspersum TaxID=6535 RepID=S4SA14_CORAP|nr:NADH dehydrogenase subunit 5 [Cornu aspersum]
MMLMLKKHPQRLTVLLFLMCCSYFIMYNIFLCKPGENFTYDLMILSTTILQSSLMLDVASLSFSAVVMYISGCVFYFSSYYMSTDMFYYRFTWILLSFVASMNILIFSNSLFLLLCGWDGLGVSSFALIMYYQSYDSRSAGFLTLLINRLGDILIMSSISFMACIGTTYLMSWPLSFINLLMFLFSIAALTKSAQYPFCAWLPAAMAAPTPVSALVHSSTLVTAGIYLLIRLSLNNTMPLEVCSMLLFFGSVTCFIGGICALYENDIKKLIALSTLSQLGVMMFSLGLGMHTLALMHLFTHAMFKALLFLVAGCILMLSYGVQDIRLLGGMMKNSPVLLVFANVTVLSLMGVPFLSAFYSKHVILSMMWCQSANSFSIILMLISTLLSSSYMLRFLKGLNWGATNSNLINSPPMSLIFYFPMMLLFFGSCFSGLLYTVIDLQYVTCVFLPHKYDILLYMLMFGGILLGIFWVKSSGSKLLSTMFFMVPISYNINFITYKITSAIKTLDSGWLEPNFYGTAMSSFLHSLTMKDLWPKSTMNFFPYLIVASCLIFSWWLL